MTRWWRLGNFPKILMSSILSKTSINRNRDSVRTDISQVSCRNKVVFPFLKLIFQATWILLKGCCQLPTWEKSILYLSAEEVRPVSSHQPTKTLQHPLQAERVLLRSCTSFCSCLPSQACQQVQVKVFVPTASLCSATRLSSPLILSTHSARNQPWTGSFHCCSFSEQPLGPEAALWVWWVRSAGSSYSAYISSV